MHYLVVSLLLSLEFSQIIIPSWWGHNLLDLLECSIIEGQNGAVEKQWLSYTQFSSFNSWHNVLFFRLEKLQIGFLAPKNVLDFSLAISRWLESFESISYCDRSVNSGVKRHQLLFDSPRRDGQNWLIYRGKLGQVTPLHFSPKCIFSISLSAFL